MTYNMTDHDRLHAIGLPNEHMIEHMTAREQWTFRSLVQKYPKTERVAGVWWSLMDLTIALSWCYFKITPLSIMEVPTYGPCDPAEEYKYVSALEADGKSDILTPNCWQSSLSKALCLLWWWRSPYMAFSKSTFNSGMVGLELERFHWKPFDKDSMDVTVTVFYRHVISFYPPAQLPLAQSIARAISPLRSLIFPHSPLLVVDFFISRELKTALNYNSGMRLSPRMALYRYPDNRTR